MTSNTDKDDIKTKPMTAKPAIIKQVDKIETMQQTLEVPEVDKVKQSEPVQSATEFRIAELEKKLKAAEEQLGKYENAKPIISIKPKADLEALRKKDAEIVKGIFRFHEVPGGTLSFNYKAYKGDPIGKYDLKDGHTYSIPLGVAKHLNKNIWYPIHAHALDDEGKPLCKTSQKVRRCSFQSLEFVDDDFLADEKSLIKIVR